MRVRGREEKLVRLLRVFIVRGSPPALESIFVGIRGWSGWFVGLSSGQRAWPGGSRTPSQQPVG